MGLIRVTAAELKSQAEALTALNGTLKTNVEEMEAAEQNLNSMWEGEAKDAFHQAFSSDKVQMANFSALIDKYAASLLNIAAKYEQAENVNVQTASARSYQ